MKLIVDENLLSFKVLEQKIFDYVCELGRQITQQILEAYDTELAESRDKKHYRGKGKRKTCIKTVYGEVEYKRTVYRTKTEQGENAYVYLLDEAMQMDKIGLISTNLAEKIAMTVTESPYRVTAETISNTCGQSISSGGVWNMMQRLGKRLDEEEQYAVKEMHADRTQGEKIIPVLFEEMDGIWLHMQDSSHKRMKKQEMKVFTMYEGWDKDQQRRSTLVGKTMLAGMEHMLNFIEPNMTDSNFAGFIEQVNQRALYTTGVDLKASDRIINLSTCNYTYTNYIGRKVDTRLVVIGRLLRSGESADVNTSKAKENSNYRRPQVWYDYKGTKNPYAGSRSWKPSTR